MDTGVRFESVLMAGFSIDILTRPDLTDPRVTYLLHEMGEETRHSRLFVRLLVQVQATGQEPARQHLGRLAQHVLLPFLTALPRCSASSSSAARRSPTSCRSSRATTPTPTR